MRALSRERDRFKKDKEKNTMAKDIKITAAIAAFDAAKGQEVFTDRPIVSPDQLNEKLELVQGFIVNIDELNLPAGVTRPDGKTTWPAFVVHLTAPTNAIEHGEIVKVIAGREVYVAVNGKNDHLRSHLGKMDMQEVIMLASGKIDLGRGKAPMQDWRVKFTGKSLVRTGGFLAGGPGTPALSAGNLAETLAALSNGALNAAS